MRPVIVTWSKWLEGVLIRQLEELQESREIYEVAW